MKTKKAKFKAKSKYEELEEQGKKKEIYKRSKNNFRTPQELQNFLRGSDDDFSLEDEKVNDYYDKLRKEHNELYD